MKPAVARRYIPGTFMAGAIQVNGLLGCRVFPHERDSDLFQINLFDLFSWQVMQIGILDHAK